MNSNIADITPEQAFGPLGGANTPIVEAMPVLKVRRTSTKVMLSKQLSQAVRDGNLEDFSSALIDGADWRKIKISTEPLLIYLITTSPIDFLKELVSHTDLDLKKVDEDDALVRYLSGLIECEEEETWSQSLIRCALSNKNPDTLEFLLEHIEPGISLWTHLYQTKDDTFNWFLKNHTPLLHSDLLSPSIFESEKCVQVLSDIFSKDGPWDSQVFIERLKNEYPKIFNEIQNPNHAAWVWDTALEGVEATPLYVDRTNVFKSLVLNGIYPPLETTNNPNGWVWEAVREEFLDIFKWFENSKLLMEHFYMRMTKDPKRTIFTYHSDNPILSEIFESMDPLSLLDKDGNTIFHHWMEEGIVISVEDLKWLSQTPQIFSTQNKNGQTPLEMSSGKMIYVLGNLSHLPAPLRLKMTEQGQDFESGIDISFLNSYMEKKFLGESLNKVSKKTKKREIKRI